MLFNVNLYNKPEDVKNGYGDIVTFEAVPCVDVMNIVKFAVEHGKPVSVVPVEAEARAETPQCNEDDCDI